MKIISWNCNGAFRKKYHLIEKLGADIIIIQECEDPSKVEGAYKEWAKNYLWIGRNKNRGLGVFAQSNQLTLKQLDWIDDGLQLFLPCIINGYLNLIAIWTKPAQNFRYIGQLWKYLQIHKNVIQGNPVIISGDLNSNVCWDKRKRWWNHSDVVRELEEIGIHSFYHELMKENQGKETVPTLYLQRKLAKPYHVDYAFISKSILGTASSIEIGKPEIWIHHSDHMPLIFTSELPSGEGSIKKTQKTPKADIDLALTRQKKSHNAKETTGKR